MILAPLFSKTLLLSFDELKLTLDLFWTLSISIGKNKWFSVTLFVKVNNTNKIDIRKYRQGFWIPKFHNVMEIGNALGLLALHFIWRFYYASDH